MPAMFSTQAKALQQGERLVDSKQTCRSKERHTFTDDGK